MEFDHIGVAAKSLEFGRLALRESLGIAAWSDEYTDPENGIYCQFGLDGSGICYEIVAPFGDASPIAEVVRTRSRVLNHVAYLVANIEAECMRLQQVGCVAITKPTPAVAYRGARIQFFLTKLRFVIELIEAPHHRHDYSGNTARI